MLVKVINVTTGVIGKRLIASSGQTRADNDDDATTILVCVQINHHILYNFGCKTNFPHGNSAGSAACWQPPLGRGVDDLSGHYLCQPSGTYDLLLQY